jgi:hypothetical protein
LDTLQQAKCESRRLYSVLQVGMDPNGEGWDGQGM